jgi:translation initiation factor IF-1
VDSDGERSAGPRQAVTLRQAQGHPERSRRVTGTVIEQLPSGLYRVRLDEGAPVVAHIADRIDRNFIRVLVGDRVHVELSRVDVGRGRIIGKV